MSGKLVPLFLTALLLLTAAATAWHLTAAGPNVPGTITVSCADAQTILHADDLPLRRVEGEILNGKGETIAIDAQGAPLSALLDCISEVGTVTAHASDGYSAHLTSDEFDRACVILQEDGSFQLIVFGDPDSRRSVRNLIGVIAE